MDEAALKKYEQEEYADALRFYDGRAVWNKRWHWSLSLYVLVVSAVLSPAIALAPPEETRWRVFASILTSTIVVATGLMAFCKFHENWLSYRATWDALKREKAFRDAGVQQYQGCPDKNALFVERIESIRAEEAHGFYSRHLKPGDASRAIDNGGVATHRTDPGPKSPPEG